MAKQCHCCKKTLGFLTGENTILPDSYYFLCDKCYSVFGVSLNRIRALRSGPEITRIYQETIQLIRDSALNEKDFVLAELEKAYQNRLRELDIDKKKEQENIELVEKEKQEELALKTKKILEEQEKAAQQSYIKEHYSELFRDFLTTTGFDFNGYQIIEYLGIISDGVVQGTGFFSELTADLSDFFGTESNAFASKMRICRDAALKKTIDAAILLGANALIGIDFDTMTFRGNMISIMATGTAVKIKKIDSSFE